MTIRTVTFHWDDSLGNCYDCGRPAAFFVGDTAAPETIRCALCAANDAAHGQSIAFIDPPTDVTVDVAPAATVDVDQPWWWQTPRVDLSVTAWRAAVAAGDTQDGYPAWASATRRRRPRLLVGVGTVDVYVYVDPATSTVTRVVINDAALDLAGLRIAATDADQEELANTTVTAYGHTAFRAALANGIWPGWDFGW